MEYLNIYFDSEFTGLRKDTELISLGFVSESGATFYAEFNDFSMKYVDEWITKNVIDNLVMFIKSVRELGLVDPYTCFKKTINHTNHYNTQMLSNKTNIANELQDWLNNEYALANKEIRFISDCYAYDWMLLCDLMCDDGCAINTIPNTSYIPIDLSTMLYMNQIDPDVNREEFIGNETCNSIETTMLKLKLFEHTSFKSIKHNSLWDAYVIKAACEKVISMPRVVPWGSLG